MALFVVIRLCRHINGTQGTGLADSVEIKVTALTGCILWSFSLPLHVLPSLCFLVPLQCLTSEFIGEKRWSRTSPMTSSGMTTKKQWELESECTFVPLHVSQGGFLSWLLSPVKAPGYFSYRLAMQMPLLTAWLQLLQHTMSWRYI